MKLKDVDIILNKRGSVKVVRAGTYELRGGEINMPGKEVAELSADEISSLVIQFLTPFIKEEFEGDSFDELLKVDEFRHVVDTEVGVGPMIGLVPARAGLTEDEFAQLLGARLEQAGEEGMSEREIANWFEGIVSQRAA